MLSRLQVRNFQSLSSADFPLGRLTVITGPNNSGKSALFRAVLLLARNARGTGYITAAERSCTVSAGGREWAVRITRSVTSRGRNEYQVARAGTHSWDSARFTKLGGQVPAEAAALLGLAEVNFARQGDSPFLLAAPGTEIARRLGDLTNVSLVFGAASEAGRRRKRLERDLEAARKRREALLAEAQQFAGLKRRLAAVREAEAQLGLLEAQAAQAEALRAAAGRLERAEAAVAACRAEAARQAPPSTGQLDELVKRLTRLRELSAELAGAESQAARLRDEAARALAAERDAHAAVHGALVAAGACPTCGQAVA